MKDTHVLVVEDSLTQAEATRALLEPNVRKVTVMPSAEDALAWLQSAGGSLPDIILSDIVMPGLSGYDLARHVKQTPAWARIPVVLLTSLSDPLDIVRGLECGADNYVTKPFEPEHLLARLDHVMAHRRLNPLRATLGIDVHFLGTNFTINSGREQILDLFLSSVEDVVRTNRALEESQQELAEAQRRLEEYARRMAHRAHTSAERLRTVVEASPMAIVARDLENRVTLWNPAAERIFGYTAEEAMGQNIVTVPPGRRAELDEAIQRARAGHHARIETQRLARDGRLIDVAITMAAVRDPNGTLEGFMGAVEDITEQKRTADALARSEAQLVQAQKMEAIGTLAGGIAHDFNNLLTVMRSYSAMLVEDLPPEQEEHRRDAEEILGAADRAAALTRQLLSFSRRQVVQPRLVRLNEVIEGVQSLLERLLPANVRMAFQFDAGEAVIRIDPGQLEQVLMNLVINASQAMAHGGSISVRTSEVTGPLTPATGALGAGAYACVTVTDTGIGMDEETQAKIFEPFFTTKPAGVGTGLGMSIVRSIVSDCGGGIAVRSAPGAGTTFDILLPVAEAVVSSAVASPTAIPQGHEVVLVVEDDEAVRAAVRLGLERFGYTVLDAHDGAQALRVAEMLSDPPDLLLTDLMMPEVSGRELVEELEREGRMPKVLLMSGYANDEVMRRGLADQKYPFIQKPFTREALARKVREVLDSG